MEIGSAKENINTYRGKWNEKGDFIENNISDSLPHDKAQRRRWNGFKKLQISLVLIPV